MDMGDIFISYSHQDPDQGRIVGKTLQEMGWNIWQDIHNLRACENFTEEIMQGIRDCSIFLMLYSSRYRNSDFCNKEFAYATNVCQKNITCIMLEHDASWVTTHFAFHFSQDTIPGYGESNLTEEKLKELCERLTRESHAFIALRNLRDNDPQRTLDVIPYQERPKMRLRSSYEIAVRRSGQYAKDQVYNETLALRFVKDMQETDENLTKNAPAELPEIIPSNKPSRIVISGNGGMGKTTAMLEYGRKLLESQPVVYIHLPDVNFNRSSGVSQYNCIESYIHERVCARDESWNYLCSVGQRLEGEGILVTVLLDGINELSGVDMQCAINEIADMATRWRYTNLIVSTRNPAALSSSKLDDFDFYSAVPLSEESITAYLEGTGINVADEDVRRVMKVENLLQNPLRLMLYVQTKPFYNTYREITVLRSILHEVPNTASKIMDNYLASLIYHYLDSGNGSENDPISVFVLGELIVPYIAWTLYQQNRFSISKEEYRRIMEKPQDLLPDLWAAFKDDRIEDMLDHFGFIDDYTWNRRSANNIMKSLNILQEVETEDGESLYVFSHQSFRDYYAARFLAADLKLHLAGRGLPKQELALSSVELTDEIIELVSGVLEEEEAKPVCDEMKGWQFPGKAQDSREASRKSCAEQALGLLRNRTDEQSGIAVKNLMSILCHARDGLLAMCCFDGLNFSKCKLQHRAFSLWHRDQLCTSTFNGAYMDSTTFFNQAHASPVLSVCAGSHGRLLSGNADGELLETDVAKGIVTGKWTLPEKEIRGIAWNEALKQAALITPHSLYLFDKKTQTFHLIVRQEQRWMQKVRFGNDGKVDYAVDIYPMVWFRPDGNSTGMEDRPPWLSGAYVVKADGSRCWRSCLNRRLFIADRTPDGKWRDAGEAGSMKQILDEGLQSANRIPKKVADLMNKNHSAELSGSLGNRITCMDLSPAGDRILIGCGCMVMELDADQLVLCRMRLLDCKVSSVCYMNDEADNAYAAIGWGVNVTVLNQNFSIISTCYGQAAPIKKLACYDAQGRYHLLCSDGVLRRMDAQYRVERARAIPHSDSLKFFDPDNGMGLQIAYPLLTKQYGSGERYEFETGAIYPLREQYYQGMHYRNNASLRKARRENTVYYLNKSMYMISRETNALKEIKYASGLCIFGCAFRDLKGGITEDEKEILYMNGGEFQ